MVLLPLSSGLPCVGLFIWALLASLPDIVDADRRDPKEQYAPVLRVTIGFVGLYFAFLFLQSGAKFHIHQTAKSQAKKNDKKAPNFSQVKYGSSGGDLGLLVDRTVGNMMEQVSRRLPFVHATCDE